MTPPPPPSADTIFFRPSKKRKVYRQRAADDENEDSATSPTIVPLPPATASNPLSLDELISSAASKTVEDGGDEVEAVPVSMAEILRLRKMKKRAGGVEFRAETQSHSPKDDEKALVQHEGTHEETGGLVDNGVPRKFAPQTGAVGDVNRHMMAYIDSELAKRRVIEGTQTQNSPPSYSRSTTKPATSKSTSKELADVQRQPAALGKLQEVDLGDDVRSRNIELTNRARRILGGETVTDEVPQNGKGKPVKVRLGPDGKPWRGRKRRASEDVARDKLVEEVLRENRLEIYEEPVAEQPTTGNNEAADDRIAEEFRREFMDAVSQRQRKKAGPPAAPARTTAGGKKEEEAYMKGPKLGGSRTARAAMREAMLKAKK